MRNIGLLIQKCKKLPRYCTKDIGKAIQKLVGYVDGNWTVVQYELKKLFWQVDPTKDMAVECKEGGLRGCLNKGNYS